MPEWHIYLVRCRDGALYTGIATDVSRRFEEHQSGGNKGAKFLRGRGPLDLVFHKTVGSKALALKLEYRIKKLSKVEKEKLVLENTSAKTLIAQLLGEAA